MDRKIKNLKEIKDWNAFHRTYISYVLRTINWFSLFEIECGQGANILQLIKTLPKTQLGGSDNDPKNIESLTKVFKGGVFKASTPYDVMMSDKASDVVLAEFVLARYPKPVKLLEEFKRIGRKYLILYEFHREKWWQRLWLRFKGIRAYDYRKLLKDFYDVEIIKVPENEFIIKCKIPKRG